MGNLRLRELRKFASDTAIELGLEPRPSGWFSRLLLWPFAARGFCGNSSFAMPHPHTCLSPSQGRGCTVLMSENPLHTEVPVKGLCHGGGLAQSFRKEDHTWRGQATCSGTPNQEVRELGILTPRLSPARRCREARAHLCHGLLEPAGPSRPGASLSRLPRPRLYFGEALFLPEAGVRDPVWLLRGSLSFACGGSPLLLKTGSGKMVGKWAEATQRRGEGVWASSQSLLWVPGL